MMKSRPTVRWLAQRLGDVPKHNDWLAPAELEVLKSKKIVKRRSDWRLGRWTAKRALLTHLEERVTIPDYNEIEIRAAADGGPEVFIRNRPAPVTISLSHSHGVALCAVAGPDTGVGCDVETIERRSEVFVSDYFAWPERNKVWRTPEAERPLVATLIWSAKESVLKAVREGLRRDPRGVIIDIVPETPSDVWTAFPARCPTTHQNFDGWWRVFGGHVYTVACRTRSPQAPKIR
jgi:4'-phosphopantetheinyl transferase